MAGPAEREVWRSSGYRSLERTPEGRLRPSDDFLRAFLARPGLGPGDGSCAEQVSLHQALLDTPWRAVEVDDLMALPDARARDAFGAFLTFRTRLETAATLEAAYLDLVRRGLRGVAPLYLNQLTHVLVRHVLDGSDDPFRFRAGELLFREQRVISQGDRIVLIDREVLDMTGASTRYSHGGPVLVAVEAQPREIVIEVLTEANAASYWDRSDRFDMMLDLDPETPGPEAFCRVLEAWIEHLAAVRVVIQPVPLDDERRAQAIGLDHEASQILSLRPSGGDVWADALDRLLGLFRLDFEQPLDMLERVRGRPVHLGLAMTPTGGLKVRPQNLIAKLPLARAA